MVGESRVWTHGNSDGQCSGPREACDHEFKVEPGSILVCFSLVSCPSPRAGVELIKSCNLHSCTYGWAPCAHNHCRDCISSSLGSPQKKYTKYKLLRKIIYPQRIRCFLDIQLFSSHWILTFLFSKTFICEKVICIYAFFSPCNSSVLLRHI